MNSVSGLVSSLFFGLSTSIELVTKVYSKIEELFQRTVVEREPDPEFVAPLIDRVSPPRSPVRPPSPTSKIAMQVLRNGEQFSFDTRVRRVEFDLFVDPTNAKSSDWKKGRESGVTEFSKEALEMRYPVDSGENRRHAVITLDVKWRYKDEKWEELLHHVEKEWLKKPLRECLENDLQKFFKEMAAALNLQARHIECDVLIDDQQFVAPAPPLVKTLLEEFFRQLAIYCRDERAHPLAVAAFIHWSICRIRPFEDGNGSVARLYMNVWLMQRGYQPLVVRAQDEYLKQFLERDYIQAFGQYLSEHL